MQYLVPENTTFTKMVCRTSSSSGSTVFTLHVNGTSRALTCTSTTGNSGSVGTGSVAVQAGDLFSISADATNSTSRYVWWALY